MAIPYKVLLNPPYNLTCQKEREKTRFLVKLWRATKVVSLALLWGAYTRTWVCVIFLGAFFPWFSFIFEKPTPMLLPIYTSCLNVIIWTLLHNVSPENLPSIKAMDPILALVKFSEKLDQLFRQWKRQCRAVPLSLQGDKAILQQTKIWIKDVFWSKD